MMEFVTWCCAVSGNVAKTISGKLAAVQQQQYFPLAHGQSADSRTTDVIATNHPRAVA